MTAEELKFALQVESVLNSLPDPEYRQLVVEVLVVCDLLSSLNPHQHLHRPLVVNEIIRHANYLFLQDQVLKVYTAIHKVGKVYIKPSMSNETM